MAKSKKVNIQQKHGNSGQKTSQNQGLKPASVMNGHACPASVINQRQLIS